MKKIRLTAVLLALVLLAGMIPLTASAETFNFKAGDQVKVTASYLRYREGYGTNYSIMKLYPNGTTATVLEASPKNLWFRCKMPDGRTDGWFWGGYLVKVGTTVTGDTSVAGNYTVSNRGMFVNLRASANGTILTRVTDGSKVKVMSASNGWSYVKYGSYTGYMMSHFLVKK